MWGGRDGNVTVEPVLRGSRRATADPSGLRCGWAVSTRRVALDEGERKKVEPFPYVFLSGRVPDRLQGGGSSPTARTIDAAAPTPIPSTRPNVSAVADTTAPTLPNASKSA